MDDHAFPGLEHSFRVDLFIPAEEIDKFNELFYQEEVEKIIMEEGSKRKFKWGRLILILYALGMTFMYVKTQYTLQRHSTYPFHKSSWSSDLSYYSMIDKRTGKTVSRSYDSNFNDIYEKIEEFSNGKLLYEWYDNDEDGYYELSKKFDHSGKVVSIFEDRNADSYQESGFILLENGDSLKFVDRNWNGQYELDEK